MQTKTKKKKKKVKEKRNFPISSDALKVDLWEVPPTLVGQGKPP
jgi:hypothetical protein